MELIIKIDISMNIFMLNDYFKSYKQLRFVY